MKLLLFKLLPLLLIPATFLRADDQPLVVVSARQYLVKGDSNVHLYLYSLDGKLIKQLTNVPGQDDRSPMFSHDGKSIRFTRTTSGAGLTNVSGKYTLQLATGVIDRLPDGPPLDFNPTLATTEFGDLAFVSDDANSDTSLDKNFTLIQKNPDSNPTYFLKTSNTAKPQPLSSFPGYEKSPNDTPDGYLCSKESPFLLGPSNYGALFVNRHRESMWVFDLHGKTWHKMQPDWLPGDIYAPQGKAGFYFVRCSMDNLGDTGKSVLCGYLEWWDAQFHHVLLAPPLSVIYGAATYYGDGETSCFVDEQRGS